MAVQEVSVLSHVTNSALVVYSLQFLKGTQTYRRFAEWMPMAEHRVHVLMSALGALGTAAGMHGAVVGSVGDGWQLTLAIPPLWVIGHAIWDWAQQFALNQLVFAVAVQQHAAAPVLTEQVTPKVAITTPLETAPIH